MIFASQLVGIVRIDGAESGTAKLLGVGAASDSVGKKLALLGVGGVLVAAAGLAVLGAKAVSMAGDFQQGVVRLRTGAGDVTDSFASLSSGILGVSVATGQLTGPLTQAMYLILSSGQRGVQAYSTLAAAAKGAVIEQAKVGDVANVLSGLMTNYGTKVFGATQYMNGLIEAVKHGKITLQDLSTAMGPIDPIARSLGISMADVAAAMTTQTNAMIPAARAATGLRFLMQSLEKPTHQATAAMQAMGLNTIDVANEMKLSLPGALDMIYKAALKAGPETSPQFARAFSDMVGGVRSFTAATALTGPHMQDFIKNSAAISAAMRSGATDVNGWADVQNNFNLKMDKARAAFEAWGISIGQILLPYVGQFIDFLTNKGMPLLTKLSDWVIKQALPNFLKFSDWLVHVAIPYIQGLADTVAKNLLPPLGDLIGNVVGIVTQFGGWVTQSGLLAGAVGLVSSVLGTLVRGISDLVSGLRDGNPLVSALVGLLAAVGTAVALIRLDTFVSGLRDSFNELQKGAGLVSNLAAQTFPAFANMLGVTKTAMTGVGEAATGAEGATKLAAAGMSAAMGVATLGFSAAAAVLVTAFMMAKDHITTDFSQMGTATQKVYDSLGKSSDDMTAKAQASSVMQKAASKATADEMLNQSSRGSGFWTSSFDKIKLASADLKAKMILDQQAVANAAFLAAQKADSAWTTASQNMSLVALLAAAGWTGPQIAAYTGGGYSGQAGPRPGQHAYAEGGPVLERSRAANHPCACDCAI